MFIFEKKSSPIKMKTPPYLQKGDTVALVCTARKFTVAEAQPAIELLESWGLKVLLGKTIGLDNFQLGGSDGERAEDFQNMLDNDVVKAIWCARGGYGTVRIIDKIDFTNFIIRPKWVMGFSDVTVLHSHIHNLGIATLHSIMPFSVPKAAQMAKDSLQKTLFGQEIKYKISSSKHNKTGKAKGQLVGGNLSILYSLLGSPSSINTENKILYIEDLDEYLYHIDRMMMNLKRNGYFDKIKGLIVGGMTDMHDNLIPFGRDACQIICEVTREFDIPIVFDFPAGHLDDNRALMLGKPIQLEVSRSHTKVEFIV